MDSGLPVFLGFTRQGYWIGLSFPSGNLPDPGSKPRSPTLQADSLQSKPPVQFSSVTQSCLTVGFCDPMDCSTPGLPVHHQLSEFTQTHVHWVGNAIDHLIFCHSLLLLPSIFPSIRVFSNESALRIRWPKYWSFSFSISPSNEHPGLLGWTGWISLQSKRLSGVFSNTTVQKHQFFSARIHTWLLEKPSNRMWSTGEGNGKPLQHSCLENPMNSMKRQKDKTLKDELSGQ